MMRRLPVTMIGLGALAALGACATPTPPVDVTRFHLGQAIERGTIFVEPVPGGDPSSLEFGTYAAAVATQLRGIGYVPTTDIGRALYVAVIDVQRGVRPAGPARSPVTIGVGGGTGGWGGGVGGGVSFGVGGGGQGRAVIATELRVQLKRRSDGSVMWEGRARTEARESAPAAQPGLAAERLADALFQGFPGESGRTITVK
jgi:hypothetical protein